MSHLGRPKEVFTPELSLKPCAKRLSELLGREVLMASDCVGEDVLNSARRLKPGQILLLENLRFHRGEEHPDKDPTFVKQLADLGEVYVNDAFGTAHRSHASTAAIAKYFPGLSAAGFLMDKEIKVLGGALTSPKRPFCAILGGAKVSTKFGVIQSLMKKADSLLIGGGMAFTFLKAQGFKIGNSLCEDECLEQAKTLLAASGKGQAELILPVDVVIAKEAVAGSPSRVVDAAEGIPEGYQGLDIGPKTIQAFAEKLKPSATVLWNGPLGVFEVPDFAKGTNAIAQVVAGLKAITIVGGGDSIAALHAAGVADKITHLSTGGGASLEFIEFGTLPGIEALTDKS
jgi:phosphoglycerate kinase